MGCVVNRISEGESFRHDGDFDNEDYDDDSIIFDELKTSHDFANFKSYTVRSCWNPTADLQRKHLTSGDHLLKAETYRSCGTDRKPTLSYISSLAQLVQFQLGNELLCMTWNIHNDKNATPFEYYCDFRAIGLKERHSITMEIIWDVARVFLSTSKPTPLCTTTKLNEILPQFLLNAFDDFSVAAKILSQEKEKVIGFPNASIYDFLTSHSYNEGTSKMLQNQYSFIELHRNNRERKTSPLRLNYEPLEFRKLLKVDPTVLPLLILDFLHFLVIKFSAFLIENQLEKAFSEYESKDQLEELVAYSKQHQDCSELSLPKMFLTSRRKLYKKWNLVFTERNKIKQLLKKACETQTDIILLQQVTKLVYKELVEQMSKKYDILPKEFPVLQKETTVICLEKTSVQMKKDSKIKYLNEQNFVVQCLSSDILFYVGVVYLTPGKSFLAVRKSEVSRLRRAMGENTPVIVGGNFNEDLTGQENSVAKLMLKNYNGIDHTQEQPLVFSVNRRRTHLQFEVSKAGDQDQGVNDGIFSSFPLVGEAFTNFIQTGMDNPSDHGPVFQRIMLAMF